jgi:glyoxylase-like metal-dependent hydrolase (beta-lactamase superfamily II)
MMRSCLQRMQGLLAGWAMAVGIAAGAVAPPVCAQTPAQQTQQVPGYFRMALGGFEVTALYDGYVDIDSSLLSGAGKGTIQSALASSFQGSPRIQTAVNAYLVHTDKHVILIDTGTAKLFGPHLGFLLENLRAAGYDASQIDTVVLTHLHPDHAGGLLTDAGKMAFPHAQVFVSRADAEYWLSEARAARAPKAQQGLFAMSRDAVAPYVAAGRLTIFDAGQAIRDGVTTIAAAGHTPGHTAYLFSSHKQRLLVWGDLVHNAAVQFPHPGVAIEFDWDKAKAVAARRTLFAMSGSQKLWVAGAHIPFPGIGRVFRDRANGYRWVPVEYQGLPNTP